MTEELLTVKQALARLNMSRASLYRFIEQDRIKPVEQETALERPRVRFKASDVERLLTERKRQVAEQAS